MVTGVETNHSEKVTQLGDDHPIPQKYMGRMSYGTAGYRGLGCEMAFVAVRMGLIAALRSKKEGQATGIVITASHNPAPDNGVKLIDVNGEMLCSEWETACTRVFGSEPIYQLIDEIAKTKDVDLSKPAVVFVGYDTRETSIPLTACCKKAIGALTPCEVLDVGLVTTPQVHFIVDRYNRSPTDHKDWLSNPSLGVDAYNRHFGEAFLKVVTKTDFSTLKNYTPGLVIDGANGVGAPRMASLLQFLSSCNSIFASQWVSATKIEFDGNSGVLNHECGADFVKSNQKPPVGLSMSSHLRYASFDGDADRLVCYFTDDKGNFHLLDGDRIAILYAHVLSLLLKEANLEFKVSVIQTAYANGASTAYLASQGIETYFVPTGVKYLHRAAKQHDVSVYFEANGHGTVLFSSTARAAIEMSKSEPLRNFIAVVNPVIGDAISDLLLVELCLMHLDWSCQQWFDLYDDLPNMLMKLSVADRKVIETTDAERRVLSPADLQLRLDATMASFPAGARTFVRPSGTEDVVRIYAEAKDQEDCQKLILEAARITFETAGGIGEKP